MKRWFSFFIVIILSLSLFACELDGNNSPDSYESISNSETQTSQPYETDSEIETANSPAAEKATEAITPKPTIKPTTEPTNKPTNKLEKNDNQTVFFVWIPKTGTKYHSLSTCSNMRNPSKVTEQEAVRRGFSPCKKCW